MKGVRVIKVKPIATDFKGATYELFRNLPGVEVILFKRKKGIAFGKHFHKGSDPSKNPERFFIISDTMEMKAYNGLIGEQIKIKIKENSYLEIEKNVYHEFKSLKDSVFIEFRSTIFDKKNSDTYPMEEYKKYLKSV